jgi:hypothetical protein
MNFLTYPDGVINLDQVTRVIVDSGGAFTFYLTDGGTVNYGLSPSGTKVDGLKAIQQITGASDIQVYDF